MIDLDRARMIEIGETVRIRHVVKLGRKKSLVQGMFVGSVSGENRQVLKVYAVLTEQIRDSDTRRHVIPMGQERMARVNILERRKTLEISRLVNFGSPSAIVRDYLGILDSTIQVK